MTEIASDLHTQSTGRAPARDTSLPAETTADGDWNAAARRLIRLRLDLHDGPMQDLVACGFALDLLRRELEGLPADTAAARRQLDGAMRQLGEVERALRSLAADGRNDAAHSIVDVVDNEIARFAQWNGARVELDVAGDVEPATDSQRIALQSVLREALTNIARHADATEVRVEMFEANDIIYLRIRDNGKGCDPVDVDLDIDGRSHLGLAGMRERLELLDGSLVFASRPGGPTTVTAALKRWRPVRQLAGQKKGRRKAGARRSAAAMLKAAASRDDR
jgi:signal transduction histidine kinase